MITDFSPSAKSFFKKAKAAPGSDAAKLEDIRSRQILRRREARPAEIQQRLAKRNMST